VILMVWLALVACGAGGDGVGDGVATSLEVEVSPGGVELTLYVTNAGPTPVIFTFPSAQRYDFGVIAESGEEVWRWSDGVSFAQVVTVDTLASNETWRMTGQWSPGERAGPYTAVAELAGDGVRQQRVVFELP
jgi:hypothetical protein